MKYLPLVFAFFQLFSEEHVSVRDVDLPQPVPTQEILDPEPVWIENLRGIVLLPPSSPLLSQKELQNIEGSHFLIRVPGNAALLSQSLNTSYVGHPLTPSRIKELKDTIYAFYKRQDHPFILIETPPQNFKAGVVQLRVFESTLGSLEIEGTRWSNPSQIKRWVHLQPGEPVQEAQLLDSIRFVNKNPFRNATVVYKPGKKPLTTDIDIEVSEQRPFRLFGTLENNGVQWTGRQRWVFGLQWANALNLGHFFAYQYVGSSDFSSFQAHTATYIAYLPWENILSFFGGYSTVNARVPGSARPSSGFSGQASTRYTVPLRSRGKWQHEIIAGADYKTMNQTVEFGGENPTAARFLNLFQFAGTYTVKWASPSFTCAIETDLLWSPGGWLPNQSDAAYDSLRLGAKNRWVYFRGRTNFFWRMPFGFETELKFEGQWASCNLLPSEQIGIGGFNTVRGYEERQLNKDSGIVASYELRTPPFSLVKRKGKRKDLIQFLGFIDYGYGTNHNQIPPIPISQHLCGIGPGVRYQLLPYLMARLDWGWKLTNSSLFGGGPSMSHFSATASF
jgi:hemolysin activation/secretion protein